MFKCHVYKDITLYAKRVCKAFIDQRGVGNDAIVPLPQALIFSVITERTLRRIFMAEEIKVDYQQLSQVASKFNQQSQAVGQMQQRPAIDEQIANRLAGASSSQAFFSEMNGKVLPALRRLVQALAEANRVTKEIGQLVQTSDQQAADPSKMMEWLVVELVQLQAVAAAVCGRVSQWVVPVEPSALAEQAVAVMDPAALAAMAQAVVAAQSGSSGWIQWVDQWNQW